VSENNGKSNGALEADVVIVGAGPAGTAMAAHLGQLGVPNVTLLDKHDFPRDKTCGSGVSPKGIQVLRELGVWDEVEKHAYRISGLRLVTPGGRESYQSAGTALDAVVCQRRVLDHLILKKALAGGVNFIPHFTADRLVEEGGRVRGVVAKDGREVRAKYTIIAGGTHCSFNAAAPAGGKLAPARKPRKMIQAIMGWWDDVPFRDNHVEMIFDHEVVPYYGWLFPESPTRVNIGITYEDPNGKRNARELFQRFLDRQYGERLKNAKQIGGWKGHPVAYSYEIEALTSPGRFVIGESGLLTHPATAEGIYQGMKSGMLAAESVRDILVRGIPEHTAQGEYERNVKEVFRLSFLGGGLFRRLVKTPILDWLVKASEQPIVKSATARVMASM
jgi:geranylgeranyl reductase family protein